MRSPASRLPWSLFTAALLACSFCGISTAASPLSPANSSLGPKDTVVLVGGTNSVQSQFQGYLEALLVASHPTITFRNLSWEADTVYRQQRPLNFPDWQSQLKNIGATVVVIEFGQMEALDGPERIADFVDAYRAFLDQLRSGDRRLVLVSPPPFEKPSSRDLPDLTRHNEDVRRYAEAIEALAREKGDVFIDLFGPLINRSRDPGRLTSNGVHLTADGYRITAELVAPHLGGRAQYTVDLDPLRAAINRKNQLWFQYWRPTNWAFLHGDRTHVPSSRDHRDFEIRWFPAEMEQFVPLIEAAEARIRSLINSSDE